jgi:two-component system chemotaxis response regulator CheB
MRLDQLCSDTTSHTFDLPARDGSGTARAAYGGRVYAGEHKPPPAGVVVIAASFGGLDPIRAVLAALPADFPLPVVVVMHRAAAPTNVLAGILSRHCILPVDAVGDGYRLAAGRIAVLPGGYCSRLTAKGSVTVAPTDRERLCADVVLADAAEVYGRNVLAVVLTGKLADGAVGVRAVKLAGGMAVVQDPAECLAPGMPTAALSTGCVDHRLPLAMIGPALIALAMAPGAADLLRVPMASWAAAR